MKKLICILLSLLLVLAVFSACGKEPTTESGTEKEPVTDTTDSATPEAI